jgi:hypothetical protein
VELMRDDHHDLPERRRRSKEMPVVRSSTAERDAGTQVLDLAPATVPLPRIAMG